MHPALIPDLVRVERAELLRRLRRDRHGADVRASRTARRAIGRTARTS